MEISLTELREDGNLVDKKRIPVYSDCMTVRALHDEWLEGKNRAGLRSEYPIFKKTEQASPLAGDVLMSSIVTPLEFVITFTGSSKDIYVRDVADSSGNPRKYNFNKGDSNTISTLASNIKADTNDGGWANAKKGYRFLMQWTTSTTQGGGVKFWRDPFAAQYKNEKPNPIKQRDVGY